MLMNFSTLEILKTDRAKSASPVEVILAKQLQFRSRYDYNIKSLISLGTFYL